MTFQTAIAGTGAMATLYQLTLSDATVKYWTSYNQVVTYGAQAHTPIPGLIHSKFRDAVGAVQRDVSLRFPPDNTYIDWADIQDSGLLKNATIIIIQTSVADPDNDDRVILRGRYNGAARDAGEGDAKFGSKFLSRKMIVPPLTFSQDCDKWLTGGGTPGCSLVLADLKETGAAEAGTTAIVILDATNLLEDDDFFQGGYLEMTSGTYDGEKRGVIEYKTGIVTLESCLTGAPGVGDTFDIYPHCRGTWVRCNDFSNTDEFFGFEYAPRDEDIYV